jgi:arabinan endo-1,5-alpha-L-arabinosidase
MAAFRPTLIVLAAALGVAATPALVSAQSAAPAPGASSINDRMTGDLTPAHDPTAIKQGDTYYVFTTSQVRDGNGLIHIRSSKDLVTWTREPSVFAEIPAWAKKAIKGTVGIWAPDVSFSNGRYRVYYSVSTFGSNRSAIGLATTASLNPKDPDYGWRDEGEIFSSTRADDYNAIDANAFVDREGRHWLSFGSFWTGLKMFRLDPATGKQSAEDRKIYSLARRATPGAIEAPYIIDRNGYYYLFASNDSCCRGANSTYYTVVGRSKDVTGPYLDYDGKRMMDGYGQVVLHANLDKTKRWRGPGHVSILRDGRQDYIFYHAYDARKGGVPTLRVAPLGWTADGWPVARQ